MTDVSEGPVTSGGKDIGLQSESLVWPGTHSIIWM